MFRFLFAVMMFAFANSASASFCDDHPDQCPELPIIYADPTIFGGGGGGGGPGWGR